MNNEHRTQNTEHSVHKVQWAVACHRYYENMLKRIVLKSHTKCKNEEFLQENQRNGAPCSILSIYSFGEGIIWWCLWSWTLWSFLSYCSFHLIYFTSKFSIQIEKELNWRLLSYLTDVTHFECVLQCIQNIFFKIYAKIRIVVIGVVFFFPYVLHFYCCSAHFFPPSSLSAIIHFRLQIRYRFVSFHSVNRSNAFSAWIKCYYDKRMNNKNVVRMIWRHDFSNSKGSIAGNKYNVPQSGWRFVFALKSWIRTHSIG